MEGINETLNGPPPVVTIFGTASTEVSMGHLLIVLINLAPLKNPIANVQKQFWKMGAMWSSPTKLNVLDKSLLLLDNYVLRRVGFWCGLNLPWPSLKIKKPESGGLPSLTFNST